VTTPADPMRSFSLVTWNLWWRHGDWRARHPAIVSTLHEESPDIICCQEVWGMADGANQARSIADELEMPYVSYGWRLDLGVRLGNAIISRWPIDNEFVAPLPGVQGDDMMGCVVGGTIAVHGLTVNVLTTHFEYRRGMSARRVLQAEAVLELLRELPSTDLPTIIAADFNATVESDELRTLLGLRASATEGVAFYDVWSFAGENVEPKPTWSLENPLVDRRFGPSARIDHVLVEAREMKGGLGFPTNVQRFGSPVDGVWPSDHFGVHAMFSLL
jgi:endonuclease/exonuclease/phosphatase family metal-dependent hydrolase